MADIRESLITAARASCRQAHSPYSGIRVGAAVRAASGAVYSGTNVENAAYPLGNCAEASAIAAGIHAEGRAFRIAELAVWAMDREGRTIAASPCGGCRQRITEFVSAGSVPVHFPWHDDKVRTVTIQELLPYAFACPAGATVR
jgi:cytidine deaminase